MEGFESRAHALLAQLTGRDDAEFRDGQLDAIRALVVDRRRALVVERTGWGKSAVYFIATRLLREEGLGPTLLVSPLLALMRNQIGAAKRMGVRAETINSSNRDAWLEVFGRLDAGEVDLLLVSPERLANREFRETVLERLGTAAGLVVIDEAHCISDWGHDFRPDYRRIRRLLDVLPQGVPVLACTATANDRVVEDVVRQLGSNLETVRGPLARDGLSLHVIELPSQAARMAWLADVIPRLPGSGIVYCLTVRDAEIVAAWLRHKRINAAAYTGASVGREGIENALLDNSLKVVVATSALGMGFDKPDLAFVVHYQSPGGAVAYYQQVGRAGRQLETSLGVLLVGTEDTDIQNWFIDSAFPTADECDQVLAVLEAASGFMKLRDIESAVNVRRTRIENLMKNLEVDGAVVADGTSYQRSATPFRFDSERALAVTALRRDEQDEMRRYVTLGSGCRMRFLAHALDDPSDAPCGLCDLCVESPMPRTVDTALAREASTFLRARPLSIEPRKQWPSMSRIPAERLVRRGAALCRVGDGGWSEAVRAGKEDLDHFDDALASALADLARPLCAEHGIGWVTWVPSLTHPDLVASLAKRVAAELGLEAVEAVSKTRPTKPQITMANSAQQLANVEGAYAVAEPIDARAVLLVDDIVGSKWTITCVGSLLRHAGCTAVVPIALALSGQS